MSVSNVSTLLYIYPIILINIKNIYNEYIDILSIKYIENLKISSIPKSRGFAGVISKYGFSLGPKTHGSRHHRSLGSIGAGTTPGRVLINKKMSGRVKVKINKMNKKNLNINLNNSLLQIQGTLNGVKLSNIFIYF
uniref:Large ribosomal subunit protein uL3c n=1 Tax=Piridium sociabile TaxID=2570542 RepID=A0A5B9XVR8_9ALVE|nr:ribosomal protein L3 [Piridium sociabile]